MNESKLHPKSFGLPKILLVFILVTCAAVLINADTVAQTPAEAIRDMKDELQAIVDGNPGTPLSDKIEDAVGKLSDVLDYLTQVPPDIQAAVGGIEGAVGELAAAVKDGLLPSALRTLYSMLERRQFWLLISFLVSLHIVFALHDDIGSPIPFISVVTLITWPVLEALRLRSSKKESEQADFLMQPLEEVRKC